MHDEIVQFTTSFVAKTEKDAFLSLSEGYLKVRAIEVALERGWTLQEGAGNTPSGSIADFLSLEQGLPVWTAGPRKLALASGSADLTVVAPIRAMLEFKARPDYGTKSQAQFQEMECDVERAAGAANVAFLFVFDEKIYRSFSGQKTESRGRPAKADKWFVANFPAASEIPIGGYLERKASRAGIPMALTFWMQSVRPSCTRIVALGMREQPSGIVNSRDDG